MAKKLKDDMLVRRYESNAADLLKSSETLRAQETSTNAEIVTLKVKVKTDISGDTWDVLDVGRIGDLLQLMESIIQKKAQNRNTLTTLKNGILDSDYKKDIQDEIDLL